MRTIKALVCAAALAAGLATSLAQSNVYSLNVVGYYNLPLTGGTFYSIANQLNTTNNHLTVLIPAPPINTRYYEYAGVWNEYVYDDTESWQGGDPTLDPGKSGLFKSPVNTTLTFVGEVLQGNLSVGYQAIGANAVVASKVPQAGAVQSALLFTPEVYDKVYKFDNTWVEYTFDDTESWNPSEPTFAVGEGMIIRKGPGTTATAWVRNFTVQ
jgi:hypothetical protein